MADDLSLLFRLRADNAQAKTAVAETRAAVSSLRQSFGPELSQTVSIGNKAFADLGDKVTQIASQRLPLVGQAVGDVISQIRNSTAESAKSSKALESVSKSIQSISRESGKGVPQISSFLAKFVQIEGQAKRDAAAIDFLGASMAQKLIPTLEKTGTELASVSTESAAAGAAIGGIAIPIGAAVVAALALTAGIAAAAREIFQLTKNAAEFQGRMFDLSQQTGLAVETLSAFEVLSKTTGGEVGSLTNSIVAFQRRLEEAQDPLSKAGELFRKFNIDTSDTETSLRSAFAALAVMPEGFIQTNAAAELFGSRGGKQILAILKETNGDLDGAIKRFRELGILISTDSARAADQFNDDLALLEFQMRGLTAVASTELIPTTAEIIRLTSDLLKASGPIVGLLGSITNLTIRATVPALKLLSNQILFLTGNYKALAEAAKEAREATQIPPLPVPETAPVPLPVKTERQEAQEAIQLGDAQVAAARRNAQERAQILREQFERGRITREEEAAETIKANRRVLDSEKSRINAQIDLKQQEAELLSKREDLTQAERLERLRKASEEVDKLRQQELDAISLFETTSREIRAKAAKERADSKRNEEKNETDILLRELDQRIANTEAAIQRGTQVESTGLTIIEGLEQAKIKARRESLEEQKRIGFLTIENQAEFSRQIQQIDKDAERLSDEQRNRRLQRERAAAERSREIKLAEIDTTLELQRIAGERLIATIEALADLRIKTEEQAAKEILAIRLGLIDQEIEATEAKLKAAASIVNVGERTRTEAELNNQLKILAEQRKTIQSDGNRDIDEGRREDLENERRYADELKRIKERIRDIELDTANEVIRLMRLNFARRRDIIRAQVQLSLDEENERHRQAEERIRNLEQENRESNRTQAEKDAQQAELNRLREAELERHEARKRAITGAAKREQQEASPLGRLGFDVEGVEDLGSQIFDALISPIEALKEAFRELQDAAREFVAETEGSVVPLGEILRGTFHQVADAVGQTVANWVLLGETGPAVMRKILAQALASLAAEAAVNTIKELALGFATLFFNPAESAAHFTAAGLWASIGGVAAIAGRSVAGDLFKPKTESTSGAGTSGPNDLNPLTLARNTGIGPAQNAPQINPVRVEITVNDSKFGKAISAHVVEDFSTNGPIRQVTSGDGNISR